MQKGWLSGLSALVLLVFPGVSTASLEDDIVTATNREREIVSVQVLAPNFQLSEIAAARASRMAETQNFSHTDVDGHNAWYWIQKGGYSFTRAGENIAVNFNDASSAVSKWMNSEGHRANILNAQFQEIGVGIAEGMYKGATSTYIVQLFGTRNQGAVEKRGQVLGEEKKTTQAAAAASSQNISPVEKKVSSSPKTTPLKSMSEPKIVIKEPVPEPPPAPQTDAVQTPSEQHFLRKIFSSFIDLLTFLW